MVMEGGDKGGAWAWELLNKDFYIAFSFYTEDLYGMTSEDYPSEPIGLKT